MPDTTTPNEPKPKRKGNYSKASVTKINAERSAEMEKRIKWCVQWLRKGWRKHQIKDAIRRFAKENLSARVIEKYIAEARAILREDYGGTRDEHREDSYQFYREIRDDKENAARDRLRAQNGIDDLLGLKTPQPQTNEAEHKHVHFHQHNETDSDEAREIISAVLDRAESGRIGQSTSGEIIPVQATPGRNGSSNGKPSHTGNGSP